MYLSLPVVIFLVASLLALCGTLIAFLSTHLRLNSKLKDYEIDAELMKKAREAKHLVDLAQKKAFQIVADANLTAQEIVGNARSIGEESRKIMDKEFKDLLSTQSTDLQIAGQKLIDSYEAKLEEVKNSNINLFNKISKSIEINAVAEVEDFKKLMAQETVDSQKIVNEKIEVAYKEAEIDIQTYKAAKIKDLDTRLAAITEAVVKQTIGSSLTLKDHHALLLKALKEARLEDAIE